MRNVSIMMLLATLVTYVSVAYAAVTVSVNGSNHTIPQTNEKGWGSNVTAWIQAISLHTLQKSGGTFTLTAEVDTGATYGFKMPYLKSATSTPGTAGVLRLAVSDDIVWRNNANDGNLLLSVDGSDRLTFGSAIISTATAGSFQDSTFEIYDNSDATKKIAFQASGISASTTRTITVPDANVNLGALTNANIDAAAAIVDTKLDTIATAGKVSNSATTATDANTGSAIVARDGSGNFSAGTITAALSGNASTATALASNPNDCSSNQFATAIAASGNLTCAQPAFTDVSGTATIAQGGTNNGSLAVTAGGTLYTDGTKVVNVGAGVSGQVLQSNGSSAPTWVDAAGALTLFYVNANISGANVSLGTGSASSYTEISDAGLTLTPVSGSNAVGAMCSSTNAATSPSTSPTTCAAGNESLGFNVDIPSDGTYIFCFEFAHYQVVDSGEDISTTFQVIQTPTNAQTLTLEGGSRSENGITGMTISGGTASAVTHSKHVCGVFALTAGTRGFRLMYEQVVSGTPNASLVVMDASTSRGQRDLHIYGWRAR